MIMIMINLIKYYYFALYFMNSIITKIFKVIFLANFIQEMHIDYFITIIVKRQVTNFINFKAFD